MHDLEVKRVGELAPERIAARTLDGVELGIMYRALDGLLRTGSIECLIHGDARGADRRAAEWARGHDVELVPFPANWSRGKGAGPRRNLRMLEEGQPDLVVAFRDVNVESIGTTHMVNAAKLAGVRVIEHRNKAR